MLSKYSLKRKPAPPEKSTSIMQLGILEQQRRQTGLVHTLNKLDHLERATKRVRQETELHLSNAFEQFAQFFDGNGHHEELIVEDLERSKAPEQDAAHETQDDEWQFRKSPMKASKAASQLKAVKARFIEQEAKEAARVQALREAEERANRERLEKQRLQEAREQAIQKAKEDERKVQSDLEKSVKKTVANETAQLPTPSVGTSNNEATTSSFKAKRTIDTVLDEALERYERRVALESTVSVVLQKRKKFVNKVKVHISMMSGTISSLQHAFIGRPNNPGARSLLEMVEQKASDQLEAFMQVIADRIVEVAGQSIAPDAIKNGESNFALAYLATGLCVRYAVFYEHLMGALQSACPYIVPGLRTRIEKLNLPPEERRARLGIQKGEGDAAYLARMQSIVGWYAAFLQANVSVLSSPQYNIVPTGSVHPVEHLSPEKWEPMAHAWRWLAATVNGTKWRWTRYLVQAFIAVVGYEMSRREPYASQIVKLVKLLCNPSVDEVFDKTAKFPDDNDRKNVFKEFLSSILTNRKFNPPGREDKTVPGGWDDKRNLPSEVSENYGD